MILLIDNYDSFSYNLVQMAGSINPDIRVIRNDELTVEEIEKLQPDKIIWNNDFYFNQCCKSHWLKYVLKITH